MQHLSEIAVLAKKKPGFKAAPLPDVTQKLTWMSTEMLGQFHYLVMNPPVHSVLIEIGPSVADELLKLSNTKNRPVSVANVRMIQQWVEGGMFELTGDTVKFDREGNLIDGQHRLHACAEAKTPLTTHVVFGLDSKIFDILDQGRKRTAGDILALNGVENYTIVAAAIRWLIKYHDGPGATKSGTSPRQVRMALEERFAGIDRWVSPAVMVARSYKHPPSMVAAILYLVARDKPDQAEAFAREWVYGNRIGRNQTFDILADRITAIQRQNGGHVAIHVRSSFIITAFNYWNADMVASPRSFVMSRTKKLPPIITDGKEFSKHKDDRNVELTERHSLALLAMADKVKDGVSTISWSALSEAIGVSIPTVGKLIRELEGEGLIEIISRGSGGGSGEYRLLPKAKDAAA